jgi:hypothetical protein
MNGPGDDMDKLEYADLRRRIQSGEQTLNTETVRDESTDSAFSN